MRRRTLLIFALIFVALLTALLVQNRQLEEVPPPTRPVTFFRTFPDLALVNIQAIRLQDTESDQAFIISRDAEGNWIAPGSEGELDTEAAVSIARTIVLLPYLRTFDLEADADLATYGFQPTPIMLIEVLLVDGSAHVIAVGRRTPAETGFYALIDDRPEMYLLGLEAVTYLIAQLNTPPVA
ncbi:MAG: hypothetical protein GYB67_04245 [Chloroflexi bacterium]|nr:hypothetical protein [Chloroflexota bacterium]